MFDIERKAVDRATRKLQKLLGNNLITVAIRLKVNDILNKATLWLC